MALMHKNPKTGKWEWDDTAQRTTTSSLQRFISNDSHPADIAKFHDTESAASKPAAMNSALDTGHKEVDYISSPARFHSTEAAASTPKAMAAALTAGNKIANDDNIANDIYVSKAPGWLRPALKVIALPGRAINSSPFLSRAADTSGEIMTGVDNPDKVSTGSKFGDISADLLGNVAGFGANPGGGAGNVGAGIWKGGEELAGGLVSKLVPRLPKLGQEAVKIAGATVPYEVAHAIGNNQSINPLDTAEAVGGNVALGLLTHGLGRLGSKDVLNTRTVPADPGAYADVFGTGAPDTVPTIEAPALRLNRFSPDAVAEQEQSLKGDYVPEVKNPYGLTINRNVDMASLPDKYPLPNTQAILRRLDATQGSNTIALPRPGEVVNWDLHPGADFTVDPGGSAMAKGVAYPPSLIPGRDYVSNTGMGNKRRLFADTAQAVPRSDIGDPAYLASLQKQYNDMVTAEVQSMKKELGGTVNYMPDSGGPMLRASQNPDWYREFWTQNGRAPREGEYRDIAIRNLVEGNPDTGEPANDKFLSILSELSRGQKLPEEWHGLQQSIRDLDNAQKSDVALTDTSDIGADSLMSDMRSAQRQVEPYGLTRDMGRLNDVEANARQKMQDQMDYGQYEGLNFKRGERAEEYGDYAPTFYSQLQRTIEQKMPNRASVDQIRGIIKGGQVKDEELKWSGLDDFLAERQGQKVSKQEVLDYLKENDAQVQEVEPSSTKYDQYTLPGGENYHELLFTMPGEKQYQSGHWSEPNVLAHVRFNDRTGANGEKILHIEEVQSDWHQEGRRKGYQRPNVDTAGWSIKEKPYNSEDANDFSQFFAEPVSVKPTKTIYSVYDASGNWKGETYLSGQNGIDEVASWQPKEGVPEAPFKTTWPEFVMKRMIRYAAENGYDRISWTTGEQQAARYDLSKQIDSLEVFRYGDKADVVAYKGNAPIIKKSELSPGALEDLLGKEMADKIENQPGGTSKTYSGIDLKIGGSGMKGFYDKMIPSWLNKYAKKWGAKVENTVLDSGPLGKSSYAYQKTDNGTGKYEVFDAATGQPVDWVPTEEDAKAYIKRLEEGEQTDVHSLSITDAMRESVLYEGQPKFKKQPPEIEALNEELQTKVGPFKLGRVQYAPEAMQREDMQAADAISKSFGGKGVIPIKGGYNQGITKGRQIFLNEKTSDPVMYVAKHEIGHTIEATDPELHAELMNDAFSYATDHSAIMKHYTEQGYAPEQVWSEFSQDVLSEVMDHPDFWSRVRESSPQVIQKVIDAIDQLIAKFKQAVGDNQSMLRYISDLEAYKDTVAPKVGKHLENMQGERQFVEQYGGKWQEPAAKIGEGTTSPDVYFKAEGPENKAPDIRSMILEGARNQGKISYDRWASRMSEKFPDLTDQQAAWVWHRAQELRKNGEVSAMGVSLTKADLAGEPAQVTKKTIIEQPAIASEGQSSLTGTEHKQLAAGEKPSDNWNHVVSKTDRVWPGLKQGAKKAGNYIYQQSMDDLYRLDQLDAMQKKKTGKGFNANERAYILALNSRESGGTSKAILTDAMYDPQGNKIGESLASVTKQIPKGSEQDFSNYLIYRHAPTWLEQGRQVFPGKEGITADVARQRAAAYEQAHPEFKQVANNLTQWQRDFGKAWLVDTGIIKPETWDMFQQMYPDYIPMQRKMSDIETGAAGVKRGYANQSNPVKKAEGSQRQIIDPIESIIEHVDKYVKVSRRNEVMQAVIKNIEQDPEGVKDWIEIVPEGGEIGKSVDNLIMEDGVDGIVDALDRPFQAAHEGKKLRLDRPNVVTGMVNGEKVHVKVNDQSLLDALTNLTPQGANAIIEGVRQVTRTMKVLTTGANVFFASRNIVRDLPMSYIQSQTTNNPVRWAWDILDSVARVVSGGKYDPGNFYQTYRALGGGSHASSIASERNLLAESKASVMPGYYSLNKPITTAGRGIKAAGRGIEAFTNAVETIPRLPEYIRTAKTGGDTYGARQAGLQAAQDVTVNFSRHGKFAKDADAVIPYLNASLQGVDKLVRSYGSNPVATVAKSILAISAPTIWLYTQFNRDNPNYKQLSSYTKDNYYCIPIDGGEKFIKIAKPREAGVVFSSLVERCMKKWADDDPDGFKGFAEAWVNNFAPPIRTIAAPLNDVRRNKNFADIPIVPGYMENLSPYLQYDENTSAPAIAAAKALKDIYPVSPKNIDYLARSYTGFLGQFGIPAASQGIGQNVGQRALDVLKKTYVADPVYSNDLVTNFYDAKDKIDTARKDASYLGKESPDAEKSAIYNKVANEISDLNKQIREINKNPDISYEQKQQQTRELKQQVNSLAQQGTEGTFKIPEEWKKKPEWIVRLAAKGETGLARQYVQRNYSNNAYGLYDYGLKNGMVDEGGNPDAALTAVLSEAWSAQSPSQSKSASYQFLKNYAINGNQEQAIKWARMAKQYGLKYSDVKSNIRAAARPATPGAKTPTLEQVLNGETKFNANVASRILWAFQQ